MEHHSHKEAEVQGGHHWTAVLKTSLAQRSWGEKEAVGRPGRAAAEDVVACLRLVAGCRLVVATTAGPRLVVGTVAEVY